MTIVVLVGILLSPGWCGTVPPLEYFHLAGCVAVVELLPELVAAPDGIHVPETERTAGSTGIATSEILVFIETTNRKSLASCYQSTLAMYAAPY